MLHRRHILGTLTVALGLGLAPPAQAAERPAFSQVALDAAVKAGKPILVDVSAPWCPTCKAQKPVIEGVTGEPKFKNLVVFDIDFDTQKEALRALGVRQQSTLIVFKGGREVARSTGDTNPATLIALIDKAL